MAEAALITISDVSTYRRVDPKLNSDRFNTYVMEAQRTNLRGLLGDALYYALMADDRISGIYADLLNGKSYVYENQTIQYYGLKPALCYWWLAIFAREGEQFNANVGAIQFVDNPQQYFQSAKQKETLAQQYLETANDYANGIIKFLNENADDYPLWETDTEKSSVNFFTFRL